MRFENSKSAIATWKGSLVDLAHRWRMRVMLRESSLRFSGRVVEHFDVLSLDTKRRVIGWDVVSVGTLDSALVHPREIFLTAVLHHVSAVVVAHNHPSGDPSEPYAWCCAKKAAALPRKSLPIG